MSDFLGVMGGKVLHQGQAVTVGFEIVLGVDGREFKKMALHEFADGNVAVHSVEKSDVLLRPVARIEGAGGKFAVSDGVGITVMMLDQCHGLWRGGFQGKCARRKYGGVGVRHGDMVRGKTGAPESFQEQG